MHDNAYAHDLQVLNACVTPGRYRELWMTCGSVQQFFSEATMAESNGLLPFSQLFFEKPPLTATFPATFPKIKAQPNRTIVNYWIIFDND
jgi:hypothetical protein